MTLDASDGFLEGLRHPDALVEAMRTATKGSLVAYPLEHLLPEERRSWYLGVAMATALLTNPEAVLAHARERLAVLRARHTRGPLAADLQTWADLLDGPLSAIVAVLTSPAESAIQMRANSPFAGVLTDDVRLAVRATWRAEEDRRASE